MKLIRSLAGLFAVAVMACGALTLSACTNDGSTTTFNTAELSADAQAAAFAIKTVETLPGVTAHISAADLAEFNTVVAQFQTTVAEVAANSNGSVSIVTGRTWAKSIGTDLQTLLAIATPIVQQYSAKDAGYLSTLNAMIPLIEALAGVSVTPYAVGNSADAAAVRAALYSHE